MFIMGSSDSKEFVVMHETQVWSMGWEDTWRGEENGYPLQFSCLVNSMDRGARQAPVMGSKRVRHDWVTNTFFSLSRVILLAMPWTKLMTGARGLANYIIQFLCCVSCSVMSYSLGPPWTVACHSPLPMGFSRQEYWSGLPCPSPGDLPNPGIEPRSLSLQEDSLPFELLGKRIRNYGRK